MATEQTQPQHATSAASQPLIGRGWMEGVVLVVIFGFPVMGILGPGALSGPGG